MKTILKNTLVLILFTTLIFSCSSDDDGSTTTGNTDEYFKYTIDGVERIFDNSVEGHLETDNSTIIDRFEINATGIQPNGDVRRIGGSFSFDSNGAFMPNTTYNWGLALDNDTTEKFHFIETTFSHPFALSYDISPNLIIASITSTIPNNVGDYLEFTFTGTFDDNGTTRSISGECRVQRDADQNY